MIETIDSEKLANKVDKTWQTVDKPNKLPLNVLLQVNTSKEDGNYYRGWTHHVCGAPIDYIICTVSRHS